MLDTKLKKTHKLKNYIIALVVLMPALILVSLYPKMEKAMLDKKASWRQEWEEQKNAYMEQMENIRENEATDNDTATAPEASKQFYLQDDFVNYAVEASYYQYAMLLQEATGAESDTRVLDEYGWINDYYELKNLTPYYVKYEYQNGEEERAQTYTESEQSDFSLEEMETLLGGETITEPRKTQLAGSGYLGCLVLKYDSYGKLENIRLDADERLTYDSNIYQKAKASVEQYENNAKFYVQENLENNQENVRHALEVCPKNFQAVYLIYEDNERFVGTENYIEPVSGEDSWVEPYYSPQTLYFSTGAYWIVLIGAVFVFLMAMLLPFFKKLETGREKLFSLPTEITLVIAAAGIALAVGLCYLMSITTMTEIENYLANAGGIELLGYRFSAAECYYTMIGINFAGWALAFFMEYICAAQLRQLFCNPKDYVKNRFLAVRLLRWIHKKIMQLVSYVLDIDIHEKLHASIVKIVIANGIIVGLLCCIWFAGTLGALIYSIILYVLLKKYGSRLQGQYQCILNAARQMSEGNLHITLDEDLGIFEPLGRELEGVQKGFSKAVAEEAKSQNMKSELITNVSHDLKTPLTAIITYVDLLKKEDLTEEERRAYTETLDMKSQRLKVLIEDLFEVSKANSGNVQMNFMDVDIVQLLKEVRVELSDKIEQSNLDFRWKLPENKIVLRLDGQRSYRIFENLLNNAIKYAMPFTRVFVELTELESEVAVTFKNVSAQELDVDANDLTERFVRGDSSRNSEGSGLGLAIAKSFTELQYGKFEINVDGDLFKVCIRFPK